MSSNISKARWQFSLGWLFLVITWACLAAASAKWSNHKYGQVMPGGILLLSTSVAIVVIAALPQLRKPAAVFVCITWLHLVVAIVGSYLYYPLYPLVDVLNKFLLWAELHPFHDKFVPALVIAFSMLLGIVAAWVTSCLTERPV